MKDILQKIRNIFALGVKELRGLLRDPLLLGVVIFAFTGGVYIASTATPDSLNKATLAIVDEEDSALSRRIINAFLPPMFLTPKIISRPEIDPAMDRGEFTFVLVIPQNLQRDVLAGKQPAIQLNVDATRMSQAFTGSGYIQQIVMDEVNSFVNRESGAGVQVVNVVTRNRFNPNLTRSWFGSVIELMNNITMLAIILTGAALIREREHGTLEHLLVMPVTSFEIMVSKVWSMTLVVMLVAGMSLIFVIRGALQVPVEGSMLLFMCGMLLHLFAVTSMGIFLACIAQNMPQLGMLLILVLMPMQMLSGGMTPMESMPEAVQLVMKAAPTTHFVQFSQAILYRGAGFEVVWRSFLWLGGIGSLLFVFSWLRFRRSVT